MLRLDEIGENYENLKAKVESYTTTKTEQTRGGQKEMYGPMDEDHVCGSEQEEEYWEDVDEIRRVSTCYNCGFARDCWRTCKGKETGGDGGTGYAKGTTTKGTGKKG